MRVYSVIFLPLALLEAVESARVAMEAGRRSGIWMSGLVFFNRDRGVAGKALTTVSIVRLVNGLSFSFRALMRSLRSRRSD